MMGRLRRLKQRTVSLRAVRAMPKKKKKKEGVTVLFLSFESNTNFKLIFVHCCKELVNCVLFGDVFIDVVVFLHRS